MKVFLYMHQSMLTNKVPTGNVKEIFEFVIKLRLKQYAGCTSITISVLMDYPQTSVKTGYSTNY